jgi:hypothetical protein
MSANNEVWVVRRGHYYDIYENGCADNPYDWKKDKPVFKGLTSLKEVWKKVNWINAEYPTIFVSNR